MMPEGVKKEGYYILTLSHVVKWLYEKLEEKIAALDAVHMDSFPGFSAHKVVIEENHPLVGTNRLMLMFDAKDLQLKQWIVTDPQGYDTTVAVYNLDSSKKVDPGLFKIDFTNYVTPAN